MGPMGQSPDTQVQKPISTQTEGKSGNVLEHIYLARQPILNGKQRLIAYELLFRGSDTNRADVSDSMRATLKVINHAFQGIGIAQVLGPVRGYINCDANFLMSDLVELLPPRKVALEILESVEPTPSVVARVRELYRLGYSFALDDYAGALSEAKPWLPLLDLVKIDLLATPPGKLETIVKALRSRRRGLKLLAEKVETREQFQQVHALGFDMFQGYYFAKPQLMKGKQVKRADKLALIKLLSLVLSDANIFTLDAEFKHHPLLSYDLIRIVNSVAYGLRVRVASVRHAISVLGRSHLRRWIHLALYSVHDGQAHDNPLLQLAATRGRLMELLAGGMPNASPSMQDAAFMTGLLSLLDALFDLPREEVYDELHLQDDVRAALLRREGVLGAMLSLAEALEQRQSETTVNGILAAIPGASMEALMNHQLDAFLWSQSAL